MSAEPSIAQMTNCFGVFTVSRMDRSLTFYHAVIPGVCDGLSISVDSQYLAGLGSVVLHSLHPNLSFGANPPICRHRAPMHSHPARRFGRLVSKEEAPW